MFQKLFAFAAMALLLVACETYNTERPPRAEGPVGPPAGAKAYTVEFETGSSALSKTAEQTLDKAASGFKTAYEMGDVRRITLTGHADTVGTSPSNMALSERRAAAVMGGLMQRGLIAEVITMTARGEEKLVVKTGDDVSEAKNRVVQINFR